MENKHLVEKVATSIIKTNKQNKEDFLTGETDLLLTRKELEDKFLEFENGKSYIGVLGTEHRCLEGQGTISLKFTEDEMFFYIPDWDNFISRVNAFHLACGPY